MIKPRKKITSQQIARLRELRAKHKVAIRTKIYSGLNRRIGPSEHRSSINRRRSNADIGDYWDSKDILWRTITAQEFSWISDPQLVPHILLYGSKDPAPLSRDEFKALDPNTKVLFLEYRKKERRQQKRRATDK